MHNALFTFLRFSIWLLFFFRLFMFWGLFGLFEMFFLTFSFTLAETLILRLISKSARINPRSNPDRMCVADMRGNIWEFGFDRRKKTRNEKLKKERNVPWSLAPAPWWWINLRLFLCVRRFCFFSPLIHSFFFFLLSSMLFFIRKKERNKSDQVRA